MGKMKENLGNVENRMAIKKVKILEITRDKEQIT